MKKVIRYIADRLDERSTWLGITGLITALGVGIRPDIMETVTEMGMGMASLVMIITKD